jgi:capsular polysaccharide biosynthesis protein
MLGWPDRKIEYGTHPVYCVEKLVIPSYPPVHESELQWLRDRLLPQADEMEEDTNPNIFISRSSAIERRIVNEEEVTDFLAANGFTTQRLEENSVARNIALFNNADIVIGAHGAGLTDIVFCDDCKVVELFGSKVKWHYKRLSKELGLHYEYIQCEPESTDLVVDIDELKEKI